MDKLKEKKGITMILVAFLGFFFILFTFLTLQIGKSYLIRDQLQHVSDAACEAGAIAGKGIFGGATGKPRATIDPYNAKTAIDDYINKNKDTLGPNVTIEYFCNGEFTTDEEKKELYDAGVLDLKLRVTVPKSASNIFPIVTTRHTTYQLNPKIIGTTTEVTTKIETVSQGSVVTITDNNGNVTRKITLNDYK